MKFPDFPVYFTLFSAMALSVPAFFRLNILATTFRSRFDRSITS